MRRASALSVLIAVAFAALSDYKVYKNTDVTPCVSLAGAPCIRLGNCGIYPPNPEGMCNVSWLAEQCTETFGCVSFNSNGWLKGCADGINCDWEGSQGTDTYVNISSGGTPVPPPPYHPCVFQSVDDEWYPAEEPTDATAAIVPSLLQAGPPWNGSGWAVFQSPHDTSTTNATVGDMVYGFEFVALLNPEQDAFISSSIAVLERSFRRWGFLSFVAFDGEKARLRKGLGMVDNLVMPHYGYLENCNGYYQEVESNPRDFIGEQIMAETGNEPDYLSAIKYLPPQVLYPLASSIRK